MKIFIVNGYPGSGKDTFVDMVLSRTMCGFKYSVVDTPKAILSALGLGSDSNKTAEYRQYLVKVREILTARCNYVNSELRDIQKLLSPQFCFVMMREPHAIVKFKQEWDDSVDVVVIERTAASTAYLSQPLSSRNQSDDSVGMCDADIVIDNNGTLADLESAVEQFISKFKLV